MILTQHRIFELPIAETPFNTILLVPSFKECTVNCNLCKSTSIQICSNSLFCLIDFLLLVFQQDSYCLTI